MNRFLILTLFLLFQLSCFSQDIVKFNPGYGDFRLKLNNPITEKPSVDTFLSVSSDGKFQLYEAEYKLYPLSQALKTTNRNLKISAGLQIGGILLTSIGVSIVAGGDKDFRRLGYGNIIAGGLIYLTSYIPILANNKNFYITENGVGIQLKIRKLQMIERKKRGSF